MWDGGLLADLAMFAGDNWHAAYGGFYGGVAAFVCEIPAFAGMVCEGTGDCWTDWGLGWGDNLLDSVMILADSAIWRWRMMILAACGGILWRRCCL